MSSFRILPATQTMAALQPHMLTIELPTFAAADVARAQAGGSDARPLEIVAHELCHWFDIVGTVWGQQYLHDLFNALDRANDPAAREAAFAPAIKLFDADRAILFPTYYKYVQAGAPSDTGPGRWRMEVTSGTRIDTFGVPREDDPILFVHFSTRVKDIGRQPLSVGSLLELRAVYAELAAYLYVSQQWSDEERVVGHALFSRRVLSSMYEPELITYSAAAHFIGRALGERDIVQVLKLGSLLADFALNLTPESFAHMRTAHQMEGWGPIRLEGFRANHDRGFAFGSLGFWAQTAPGQPSMTERAAWAMLSSRLLHPDLIYGPAEEFIRGLSADHLRDPELRRIRQKTLEAGREIIAFRRMRGGTIEVDQWTHLQTPPIVDRDLQTFHAGRPGLTLGEVEYLQACDLMLNDVTRQALRAARGLDFAYTDWVY